MARLTSGCETCIKTVNKGKRPPEEFCQMCIKAWKTALTSGDTLPQLGHDEAVPLSQIKRLDLSERRAGRRVTLD